MDTAITREQALQVLTRAKNRAFSRIAEFEDPLLPMDEDYVNSEEYEHLLIALERDYCLFSTVVEWIEKYVPPYEESTVFSEYLEAKHAEVTRKEQPVADNVIDIRTRQRM